MNLTLEELTQIERRLAALLVTPEARTRMPVFYIAKPSDKTGKSLVLSLTHEKLTAMVQEATQDFHLMGRYVLGSMAHDMMKKMMEAGPWICSASDKCSRPATSFVCYPISHLDESPPHIVDATPIPVCHDPRCNTMARQKLDHLMAEVAQEAGREKEDILKAEFCVCKTCGAHNKQMKLLVCSRCKVTYYCSKECQKKDWKEHKKMCVPAEEGH